MLHMLKREHRLKSSLRIAQVRREGESCRNPWLVLSKHVGESAHTRVAFAASRRIGNAVTRNRVKRRLREAVRQHLACIEPGWDLLVIARSRAKDAAYGELERAMVELLRRGDLWTCASPPGNDPDGGGS
jgi:ribonuclease P protein component